VGKKGKRMSLLENESTLLKTPECKANLFPTVLLRKEIMTL
jgi:hypothetical protein